MIFNLFFISLMMHNKNFQIQENAPNLKMNLKKTLLIL
jgi:hypothetical protein